MSTNFAKPTYDVKLWRHKQRTPNTNDHLMTLNNPPKDICLRRSLQSPPKIHDNRWRSEQKPIYKMKVLRYLKAPVSSPRSNNAHAELRLLFQSVYQSFCSDFHHSWISPQGTWTSPPAAVYFRTLTENTALGVLRDTMPQNFQCWFSFLLSHTQQKTDQMRAEDCWEDPRMQYQIRPLKANDSSYSSQQWHPRRRVCACLSQLCPTHRRI